LEKFLRKHLALPADTVERLAPLLGELEGEPAPLDGGLTNHNYRARFGGREVVLRLPGVRTELLGADRAAESEASSRAAAAGVAPALLASLDDPPCLVFEFIAGETMTPARLREPASIVALAAALRALHACAPIAAGFDSFRLVEGYAAATREHGGEVPDSYEEAAAAAALIGVALAADGPSPGGEAPVLCHDDLLAANVLLVDGGGFKLVDWEYAGSGYRYFDLANFAVNNELEPAQERAFLAAYLEREPLPRELAALRLMRVMSDFREAMWGIVQRTVSKLEFDFDAYAGEHFERLLAAVRDPRFQTLLEEARATG
jgi:aminoglycoside phosphotransferase (APT) family kinase protein